MVAILLFLRSYQIKLIYSNQFMQEILRALYQKQEFKSKRGRYINHLEEMRVQNNASVILESVNRYPNVYTNKSQSTENQTIDNDLNLIKAKAKRDAISIENRIKYNTIEVTQKPPKSKKKETQVMSHFLPIIKKKKLKKNQRFRIAALAVCFIIRLNKKKKMSLLNQKQKSFQLCSKLLLVTQKMINGYYSILLEEQLQNYWSLLQLKISNPKIDLSKQILNNLYFISKKLSSSTIRRDFLQILLSVSGNNCFLPSDFLSQFQINRLEFSPVLGCLLYVSPFQTKMIVGLCMGIKIFCSYVLYRPWTIKTNKIKFKDHFPKLSSMISDYGSVFYYIIMDEMNKVPAIVCEDPQKQLLKRFHITPIQKINIYYPGHQISYSKSTTKDLIPNQNRQFLNNLIELDPEKIAQIKSNLIKWIDRITSAILISQNKNNLPSRSRSQTNQSK